MSPGRSTNRFFRILPPLGNPPASGMGQSDWIVPGPVCASVSLPPCVIDNREPSLERSDPRAREASARFRDRNDGAKGESGMTSGDYPERGSPARDSSETQWAGGDARESNRTHRIHDDETVL